MVGSFDIQELGSCVPLVNIIGNCNEKPECQMVDLLSIIGDMSCTAISHLHLDLDASARSSVEHSHISLEGTEGNRDGLRNLSLFLFAISASRFFCKRIL